jgi:hypothetical protein
MAFHNVDRCHAYAERMPTARRRVPETRDTQIYARLALLELAAEFREVADELERRSHSSHPNRRRAGHSIPTPARRRRI